MVGKAVVAAEASSSDTVTQRSSDGEEFEVSTGMIAAVSGVIKDMMEDDCTAGRILLPKVTRDVLSRVIEYCNHHYADAGAGASEESFLSADDDALERFDAAFIGDVDQDTLFDHMQAADYLGVQKLVDLTCQMVAGQMRGKSVEEIREHFGIVNNYTSEEEEVRRENPWAFVRSKGKTNH